MPVKTTYLEMRGQPHIVPPRAPLSRCDITRIQRPPADFYLWLYKSVGEQWLWVDRLMMKADDLRAILENDAVEVYLLIVDGKIAGYAELDRRIENEIELSYFGLLPEFLGRELGKYFLRRVVHMAWEYGPERLWVHTCELDHPAALPNYLNAGFLIYKEEIIEQRIPGA